MKVLTGVRLNPSSDLSSTDVVEEGDILAKNGRKIRFTETFGTNFRGVSPDRHVGEVRREHPDTCEIYIKNRRRLMMQSEIPM